MKPLTSIGQIKELLCNNCEHRVDNGLLNGDPALEEQCPCGHWENLDQPYHPAIEVVIDDDNVYCVKAEEVVDYE